MSNNTNTLFWVIAGAVIILSIFLLVNSSSNDTIGGINSKFSEIYDNQNSRRLRSVVNEEPTTTTTTTITTTTTTTTTRAKTQDEIDHEEFLSQSTVDYCRKASVVSKISDVPASAITIKDAYVNGTKAAKTVTNVSGSEITNIWINSTYYDCKTGKQQKGCALYLPSLPSNEPRTYICNGGSISSNFYNVTTLERY